MMTASGAAATAQEATVPLLKFPIDGKEYVVLVDNTFTMEWTDTKVKISGKDFQGKPITEEFDLATVGEMVPASSPVANEKIETIETKEFKAYFANDQLHINADKPLGNVAVINSMGQIVKQFKVSDAQNALFVGGLSSGLYIIKTDAGTVKIFKNRR